MISQILLFDQPRSASHLLYRLFSQQSQLKYLGHPFAWSRGKQVEWLMGDSYETGMTDSVQGAFDVAVRDGIEKWENALEDAQQSNQTLIVHDHPFNAASPSTVMRMIDGIMTSGGLENGNISDIPDTLLLRPGTVPVFTIRDPRITIPATFRVLQDMNLFHGSGRPNFTISTSPMWIRNLYSYFQANGIEPLIVDADDFITNPDLIKDLCTKLGLNVEQLLWSWTTPTPEERARTHRLFYASQRVLIESEGIRSELASINRNLETEEEQWRADFGEDASMVEEMIELALPHYHWLKKNAFGQLADAEVSDDYCD